MAREIRLFCDGCGEDITETYQTEIQISSYMPARNGISRSISDNHEFHLCQRCETGVVSAIRGAANNSS